jgi:transcriptional regulator with XRE-family HTH domain
MTDRALAADIAARITQLMDEHDLRDSDVSTLSGVDLIRLRSILSGAVQPCPRILSAITRVLNTSPSALIPKDGL